MVGITQRERESREEGEDINHNDHSQKLTNKSINPDDPNTRSSKSKANHSSLIILLFYRVRTWFFFTEKKIKQKQESRKSSLELWWPLMLHLRFLMHGEVIRGTSTC